MKCNKCGTEIPDGIKTCPKCSAEVRSDAASINENSKTNNSVNIDVISKESNQENKPHESDSDFSSHYSQMFEKGGLDGDKSYVVNEDLKKKREERYDESFANMSDDEKIKALEAARQARREKRKQKAVKKKSGGVFGSITREIKTKTSEIKETAQEKIGSGLTKSTSEQSDIDTNLSTSAVDEKTVFSRKDGRSTAVESIREVSEKAKPGETMTMPIISDKKINESEILKNESKPDSERTEHKTRSKRNKKKSAFSKSSHSQKSSKRDNKKKMTIPPKLGIVIGCMVAVLVVGVVTASVNMASKVNIGIPSTPTVYTKGNVLYSSYEGKTFELNSDFIENEYTAPEPEPTATAKSSKKSDSEATPTPEPVVSEPIKEKDLINFADNGEYTYYISKADMNEKSGDLNFVQNKKKNSMVQIGSDAYYDVVVSEDGKDVLYLTGADVNGYGGTLNFWCADTKTSTQVAENVQVGNFMFAQNASGIAYINEYNDEYGVGDLYLAPITKGGVGSSKKIESDVYKVYGTNPAGKTVVYSKNFDADSQCFDVYMMKDNGNEPIMITDGSRCTPVFAKNSDTIYVGGTYEDYYQTLYYASLESGDKEKIAGGLTEIIKLSKDEQAIVFRKANAEGTAFDYFYACQSGTDEQLLAQNVTVLDDEEHKRISQFEINDDFTKVAYIQGYDLANESGGLYTKSIVNNMVGSDKKISDTAYSCNLTPDGQTIRYADNYDTTWNLVTLNAYTNDKKTVLASDVGAGSFTFDKLGSYIVYAKNYSLETHTGDVYCVDNKGKTNEVVKSVTSYGLKKNGEVVYSSKANNNELDVYFAREDGKKSKSVDTGVSKVVLY